MKHRALIIGAGRIGAGWQWGDLEYTHAGAYRALADRVELVGFVEPDEERAQSAKLKWSLPVYEDIPTGVMAMRPDILSICVQPERQGEVYSLIADVEGIKGIWQEKPFTITGLKGWPPVQVNYMRRGDPWHRSQIYNAHRYGGTLFVYGKDDIHTRCHFEDLAKWWDVELDYRPFNGPCAYVLRTDQDRFFDNGGVDGGQCFKAMLGNLLDHIDKGIELWSPA